MINKLYKAIPGPDGAYITVEYSPEDYAQAKLDEIEYETVTLPREIRQQRDDLLTACDWTQANDIPQATKDKWATYRQALRDVPQQPGFPTNVVWPTKP